MAEYELYHHGVKGMKWGIRRKRKKSSTRNWSEDAKTASTIRKKSVKEMSNADLKKLNERTRLEKEYKNLNPNVVNKGWKFVVATAGMTATVLSLYNNSSKLVEIGSKFANPALNIMKNT